MQSPNQTDRASALLPEFKRAMRRLAATVTIVTTRHEGLRYGMAATAVTSVTADPPTLLVCVNRKAGIHTPISESGSFCLNLLGVSNRDLVAPFSGGAAGESRFVHGDWAENDEGLPYLRDAQACLFCVTRARLAHGSHSIIVGEVSDVRTFGEVQPLVYQDGGLFRTSGFDPVD